MASSRRSDGNARLGGTRVSEQVQPCRRRRLREPDRAMVERDGNHPSIIIWGLYNEEWGLDWDIPGSPERAEAASNAYDRLAALDHSRPIVENSGWAHVRTDLVDWHYYEPDPATWARSVSDLASGAREDFPVKLGPDFIVDKSLYGSPTFPRTGKPILNSEFGEGFTSLERAGTCAGRRRNSAATTASRDTCTPSSPTSSTKAPDSSTTGVARKTGAGSIPPMQTPRPSW